MTKIFISSTCYDLSDTRDQLERFLLSKGLTPILSDKNDVFYNPAEHTHVSCIHSVANCDMMILIIGGRFGGDAVPTAYSYLDSQAISGVFDSEFKDVFKNNFKQQLFSITHLEVLKALEIGIPILTFVARNVYSEFFVYKANEDNNDILYPSILGGSDKRERKLIAKHIFEFIRVLEKRLVGNSIFQFYYTREIEEILEKQFLGIFEYGLKNINKKGNTDDEKIIDMCIKTGETALEHMQYDMAFEYFSKAYQLKYSLLNKNNNNEIIEIISLICEARRRIGKYQEVISWLIKKVEAEEQIYGEYSQELMDTYRSLGYTYLQYFMDFDKAIEYFDKRLKIAETNYNKDQETKSDKSGGISENEKYIAESNMDLAHSYNHKKEFGQALSKCLPFVDLADKLKSSVDLQDRGVSAFIYNCVGEVYSKQGKDYDLAILYLNKGKNIREDLAEKDSNHLGHYASSFQNLAYIHNKKGEYDLAIEKFEKCLEINQKFKDGEFHPRRAVVYTGLGESYLGKGDKENAILWFNKALQIKVENDKNFEIDVVDILKKLATLYYEENNYTVALEYLFSIYHTNKSDDILSRMQPIYEKLCSDTKFEKWLNERNSIKNQLDSITIQANYSTTKSKIDVSNIT